MIKFSSALNENEELRLKAEGLAKVLSTVLLDHPELNMKVLSMDRYEDNISLVIEVKK